MTGSAMTHDALVVLGHPLAEDCWEGGLDMDKATLTTPSVGSGAAPNLQSAMGQGVHSASVGARTHVLAQGLFHPLHRVTLSTVPSSRRVTYRCPTIVTVVVSIVLHEAGDTAETEGPCRRSEMSYSEELVPAAVTTRISP